MVSWRWDFRTRVCADGGGRGSHWTRTYKPVKVLRVIPGEQDLEDPGTIAMMCQYGWRNVRGGSWTSLVLKTMPLPLARALAMRPPGEMPEAKEDNTYEYQEQLVDLVPDKTGWSSRVTGPLAVHVNKTGIKTFHAKSLEGAKTRAQQWINQVRAEQDEHESFGGHDSLDEQGSLAEHGPLDDQEPLDEHELLNEHGRREPCSEFLDGHGIGSLAMKHVP